MVFNVTKINKRNKIRDLMLVQSPIKGADRELAKIVVTSQIPSQIKFPNPSLHMKTMNAHYPSEGAYMATI